MVLDIRRATCRACMGLKRPMRRLALIATTLCLVAPTAATAHRRHHDGPRAAARTACQSERSVMGSEAFRAKYANERGRRAMRRCVRQRLRAARTLCRDERDADRAAFHEKYANDHGRRAFRGCLRVHAGA
jgi:hypothetical protein